MSAILSSAKTPTTDIISRAHRATHYTRMVFDYNPYLGITSLNDRESLLML